MRIHLKRPSFALAIALLTLFAAAVGVLAACGGSTVEQVRCFMGR